jgi:hypothetical protein
VTGPVVVRILLEDRHRRLDTLGAGVFPDERSATAWARQQLEQLRWSGVWSHADECYLAKLVLPDGRKRTGYLYERTAAVDWETA